MGGPWRLGHLGPLLERELGERLGREMQLFVSAANGDGRDRTDLMLAEITSGTPVRRRPDGRPELDQELSVTAARSDGLALAAAGTGLIALDAEFATDRSAAGWCDLLGQLWDVALETADIAKEPVAVAATRLWGVVECAQKVGRPAEAVTIESVADVWVEFKVGRERVATVAVDLEGSPRPLVVSVLGGGDGRP
jgi:enediyne polyketide synthase